MACETGAECRELVSERHPAVSHEGDFYEARCDVICARVRPIMWRHGDSVVVITAAPPCMDFSRAKAASGLGRIGPEGAKFDAVASVINQRRHEIGERCHVLVENVVPSETDAFAHFEERSQMTAIRRFCSTPENSDGHRDPELGGSNA